MDYSEEFNRKAKHDYLMLSMSGEAEEAGLQSLNNVAENDKPKNRRNKKKDKRYHDLLQLLTETQIKLQDFIDEIDTDLLHAKQDLLLHKDMLMERLALEQCIDVLDNNGLLERNADGSLKDKDLERAVTGYLEDNNMDTDLSDDARIYAVAQNLIKTYPAQDQILDVIALDKEIIGTLEHGKDEAQTLQAKLNDPDISKREVKQVSKQADEISFGTYDATAKLTAKRDALLDNTHTNSIPQQEFFETPHPNATSVNLPLENSELPATTLKF